MPKYPITPEFIQALPYEICNLYQRLEDYILTDICERVSASGMTQTAIEYIRELQRKGYDYTKINKYIQKTLKLSDKEFERIWNIAIQYNQQYYDTLIDDSTLLGDNFNEELFEQEIEAIKRQTQDFLTNITQSMGFAYHAADGSVKVDDVGKMYQRVLDDATIRVHSGQSYNEAIADATKQLTDSGLQYVDYESGWHNRVDVAARRAIMTGATQLASKYSEQNAEVLGTPYYEVTAHRGARDGDGKTPWASHKAWQGKVYSIYAGDKYPSIYEVCGLGEVDGLCGANCRHMYYPFVDGVSERTYTDEELENIDPPPFEFEGKTYTFYEATQKQRQVETALRRVKREMTAAKSLGDDDTYTAKAVRYRRLNDEYDKFTKAAGLRSQKERGNIPEFGTKEGEEAENAALSVVNPAKDVIIQSDSRPMANGMRKSASHILTDDEIASIIADAKSIEIPTELLRFNAGSQTGFSDGEMVIHIRGDVFPDLSSKNVRDRMSARAVLAHEYYGHYANHPSEYRIGDWHDEFRASREAAINTPNLTDDERACLMIDAYDRAREALQILEYDDIARRIIYGYE